MPTNLIINGTFDQGNTGWSGNDLETWAPERAYLGGGSDNRVAEMDGNRGQTTVMEQTFTVDDPLATELTIDAAMRNAALNDVGSDGFQVEILDSDGNVLVNETIYPDDNVFDTYTIPVEFTEAGDYTLRMTEVGDNDSLGAIIDNVTLMVCFAGETCLQMADGTEREARRISVGDFVMTANGPKNVKWVGRKHVSAEDMRTDPSLRPIRIVQGALGQGLPKRALCVSRQHRMLITSGAGEVLVAAHRLTELPGVYVDKDRMAVDYTHILFEEHELVFAEGAPSESLLVAPRSLAALEPDARAELTKLFPDLIDQAEKAASARLIPEGPAVRCLLNELVANDHPALKDWEPLSV